MPATFEQIDEETKKKITNYIHKKYNATIIGKWIHNSSTIYPKVKGMFKSFSGSFYVEYCLNTNEIDIYGHIATDKLS